MRASRCEDDPAVIEKYGDHSQDFKPKKTTKQLELDAMDNPLAGGGGLLASSNRQQSQDLGDKADPLQHPSGMFLRWDPGNDPGGQGEAAWMALLKKFNSLPPVDAAGAPPQEAVTFIPSHPARIYTGNPSPRE